MNAPSSLPNSDKVGLYKAVAETLTVMSVQIEAMGADLCMDPVIVQRHMTSLQTIDKLAQHLDQIALVIGASDPVAAVERVKLADLKEHLQNAA